MTPTKQPKKSVFSPRPGLAAGILVYGLGDLANRSLASLLLIPVYTHYLTAGEYGIITTLTPLAWLLMVICGTNVSGALVRFYHDDTDPLYRKRLCSTVVAYLLVVPLVLITGLYIAGLYAFGGVFPDISFFPYGFLLLWFVYFSLIPQSLLALWRTEEKPFQYALLSFGGFLVTASGIVFLVVVLDQGVYGKMLAELVVAVVMALLSLVVMRKLLTRQLDFGLLQNLLLFSAPLVPHLVARWVLNYVSRIQLLAETDLEQAGLFGLGSQVGLISLLVANSVMNALAPWFYRTAPKEGSAEVISRVSTLFLSGFIALTAFVCIFAKEIIQILAPQEFASAYPVAILMAVGALFLSVYNFPMLGLMYLKKTRIVPVLTVIAAAITICANIILIPRWGIMGAASATVIGQFVLFVAAFGVSQRLYPVRYEYGKIFGFFFVSAIVCTLSFLVPEFSLVLVVAIKLLMLGFVAFYLWFLGIIRTAEIVSLSDFVRNRVRLPRG